MCSANGYPGNYDGHVETDQAHIYVLSAKDENSCMRMVSRLCDYATHAREADDWQLLANMAYTLGSRRSNFRWKAVCTAHNLTSLAQNLAGDGMRPSKSAEQVRLGWVFTGQGAQWFAMGRELIEMYPVFKEALLECDGYIKEMGSTWSIIGKDPQQVPGQGHGKRSLMSSLQRNSVALKRKVALIRQNSVCHCLRLFKLRLFVCSGRGTSNQ